MSSVEDARAVLVVSDHTETVLRVLLQPVLCCRTEHRRQRPERERERGEGGGGGGMFTSQFP